VVGKGVDHLAAGLELPDLRLSAESDRHLPGQPKDRVRLSAPMLKISLRAPAKQALSAIAFSHIVDVGKGPRLEAVPEDRHGLPGENLVHGNADPHLFPA
jgi:hypothetical protein